MDFFAFLSDTEMSSFSVYHSGLMFIWALLDCGRKQRRLKRLSNKISEKCSKQGNNNW